MFKRVTPRMIAAPKGIDVVFPHCDQRILHAPNECSVCDLHPAWQYLRQMWGIAFTGYSPEGKELPCPADHSRGDNHKKWVGNVATASTDAPFPGNQSR